MYRETGQLGALEYRPSTAFETYVDAFFLLFKNGECNFSDINEYAKTFDYEPRSFMRLMLAMKHAWTCELEDEELADGE